MRTGPVPCESDVPALSPKVMLKVLVVCLALRGYMLPAGKGDLTGG